MVWRDVRVSQCGEIYPSLSRRAGWEALSAQERSEVVPAGSDKGPIREGPKSGAENAEPKTGRSWISWRFRQRGLVYPSVPCSGSSPPILPCSQCLLEPSRSFSRRAGLLDQQIEVKRDRGWRGEAEVVVEVASDLILGVEDGADAGDAGRP